jgi:carbonic anhydrase
MTETDLLLRNNQAYAASFDKGDLPAPPARKVAVVTCMDARLDPARALGLEEGDAHVIRNAGGIVTDDALRSLAISQDLLGTQEVVLIKHTDCRALPYAGEELDRSVREAIEEIRASPSLPRTDNVRGFVYEVETGRLREVG